ncbi:MAG TPA: hypothetical protein VMZ91_14910 [Candidatus Paceibacterota bacterium]|nr:hypothetical protein [Candidatus Paceibacterota bacterium]
MFYKDLESEKEKIREFIRKNSKTTYKEIRKKLKIHPERVFKRGMAEAFKEAGIKPPRTFKRNTKEENKKLIVEYIKKNPGVGGHTIVKEIKRSPSNFFKSIKEAYEKAGVKYPREDSYRLSPDEKRRILIKIVKNNPYITVQKLTKKSKAQPYKLFKNLDEIYEKAGVKRIGQGEKIKNRKRKEVIHLIKNNPIVTQREINRICKTHVQEIFKKGIFGAYKEAGIKFPFERLKTYGVGLKEIRQRAKTFEEKVALKLSGFGKVNRLVKTKRGFADIILERKNKKAVIEVKDYELKDVSISQIGQLNKYLEDCNCNLGFLVCYKKPKRDNFLMDKNQIFILEETELSKIPYLMDGTVG